MMFEPMIALDFEKKYFFKEVSKEMGFTALKTGIATLNCPYDNSYINENFSLNMITPKPEKEKLYFAYFNKLLYNKTSEYNKLVYKDLGLTYIAPDPETIIRMSSIAKNFNIPYKLIDPSDKDSIGLNPFIYEDPSRTAIVISSVLKDMFIANSIDLEEAFKENTAMQAIENLSILLKEMYPRLHDGLLPTLEDMLKMLNDFDLVENMCEQLLTDEELSDKYSLQIGYFKKHFYKNSVGRQETEKNVFSAVSQLDNLLRYPGVKQVLCNRTNNINFDDVLKNGDVTLVCTRRGDLGANAHKAFGLFFLLLMQYSVLNRPGDEKSRIPHFLYIDEFPDFICPATTPIFTLYRKYRVGIIISAQNLSQFGIDGKSKNRQTILANCSTKVVFGNNTPEDNEWWSKEFGTHREWKMSQSYNTADVNYDPKKGNIEWGWKDYFKAQKIQTMKFKECAYKTKDIKGKSVIGPGKVDFLESKFKEKHEPKIYAFNKFTVSSSTTSSNSSKSKHGNAIKTSSSDEIDPIKMDNTDSSYFLNNDDAIVFNLNKKN